MARGLAIYHFFSYSKNFLHNSSRALEWEPMYDLSKRMVTENPRLLLASLIALLAFWSTLVDFQPVENTVGRGGGVVDGAVRRQRRESLRLARLCGGGAWRKAAWIRKSTGTSSGSSLLSAVYVLGCGFRSILPRADVQRIALGGLVVVERVRWPIGRRGGVVLCPPMGCRCALSPATPGPPRGPSSHSLLVPLIVVAEICSWYAVLSTSYLGNAIEETLWAVTASLLIVGCLHLWSRCHRANRPWLLAAVVLGVAYVAFMATVDIPMYVSRWQADEASGRRVPDRDAGLRGRLVAPEYYLCVGRMAHGNPVDVPLFQRGRLVQYCPRPCPPVWAKTESLIAARQCPH